MTEYVHELSDRQTAQIVATVERLRAAGVEPTRIFLPGRSDPLVGPLVTFYGVPVTYAEYTRIDEPYVAVRAS